MTTQDWINEQKIKAVQDRKDGKDYWTTDNLYTEADLIELLEAFALYVVVGQSEQLKAFLLFIQENAPNYRTKQLKPDQVIKAYLESL